MDDLKRELASLRLDDEPPRVRRRAWVVIALLVFIVAASTIFWWGRGVFAATEVETKTPRVERSEGAPSGTPLLTTSGYVVARRKAVVSAKIQGRLADLRVEEGVREGKVNRASREPGFRRAGSARTGAGAAGRGADRERARRDSTR